MNRYKKSRQASKWSYISVLNDTGDIEILYELDKHGRLKNKFPRARKRSKLKNYLNDDVDVNDEENEDAVTNEEKYISLIGYSIKDILNNDCDNVDSNVDDVKNSHKFDINDVLNQTPKITQISSLPPMTSQIPPMTSQIPPISSLPQISPRMTSTITSQISQISSLPQTPRINDIFTLLNHK